MQPFPARSPSTPLPSGGNLVAGYGSGSLKVSDGASLLDVASGLYRGEEYVHRVLGQTAALGGRTGDILLRLRISSPVRMPDYRFDEYIREVGSQTSWPIAAFSGRSHRTLNQSITENESFWASDLIEFAELQLILGYYRGVNELPRRPT